MATHLEKSTVFCGMSSGTQNDLIPAVSSEPVSYTHLDVYKRQGLTVNMEEAAAENALEYVAVSRVSVD